MKKEAPRRARCAGLLPPKGALFVLGRPGDKKAGPAPVFYLNFRQELTATR